jgi:hypothetical protein
MYLKIMTSFFTNLLWPCSPRPETTKSMNRIFENRERVIRSHEVYALHVVPGLFCRLGYTGQSQGIGGHVDLCSIG